MKNRLSDKFYLTCLVIPGGFFNFTHEWMAVNGLSAIESEKERLLEPELQKRAKSKVFGFNKRGIEAVEKCVNAINR